MPVAIKAALEGIPEINSDMQDVVKTTENWGDSIDNAFSNFVTGASTAKDALRSLVNSILSAVSRQATSGLSSALGGILSSVVGGGISSVFGGGTQAAITTAQARGTANPALFGPGFNSGGGMVLGGNAGIDQNVLSLNGQPIAKTSRGENMNITRASNGGGSGVTINQTINVSTGVQETVRAEMMTIVPEIQKSTLAAMQDASNRGFD